jgi:hypothetical protein
MTTITWCTYLCYHIYGLVIHGNRAQLSVQVLLCGVSECYVSDWPAYTCLCMSHLLGSVSCMLVFLIMRGCALPVLSHFTEQSDLFLVGKAHPCMCVSPS